MSFNIFRAATAAATFVGAIAIAAPAQAAPTVCTQTQLDNVAGAIACYYDSGNINSNNSADRTAQAAIIALLAPGFIYNNTSSANNSFNNGQGWDKDTGTLPVDFGTSMFGDTIVSMHFGNGKNNPFGKTQGGGGVTAFYLLNFADVTDTLSITNTNSLSNARLFSTSQAMVPEPSAWALFILGFGMVGGAMRTRKRKAIAAF